jgi:hypothetical protein
MSHHRPIYFKTENNGYVKIGFIRITNEGDMISVWTGARLFLPEQDE